MFLYRLLSVLALLAYSPFALFRSLTGRRRIGSLRGRLGLLPYPDLAGGIWIHAVSVGEVGVASTLLIALSNRAPGLRLGISVTTAAGLEAARRASGAGVAVFSFPLDLAGPVERALSAVRPGLLLLTETELWPLLLTRARKRGVLTALVNGRISERSFRRYLLVRSWFRRVLEDVSLFAMQSEDDARRARDLGVPADRILITGNIKYDVAPAPPFPDASRLRSAAAGRPILVAGSTGEGEEELVLGAWKSLDPRPFLAIAPRRPERFDEVARLVESSGFTLIRRSRPDPDPSNHNSQITDHKLLVYLLDSIGELASLYGEANLAFLGGSLIPTGGHNPIEAWAQGVAVVVGPHTHNFREITRSGESLGILERVPDAGALARAWDLAFKGLPATAARGERARSFVAQSRGAAASTADAVLRLLSVERRERAAAP